MPIFIRPHRGEEDYGTYCNGCRREAEFVVGAALGRYRATNSLRLCAVCYAELRRALMEAETGRITEADHP